MRNVSVILKMDTYSREDKYLMNRVSGQMTPKAVINLLNVADLRANPRDAKDSRVTEAIVDSLERTPDLHHFKTKGILISASGCEQIERDRFRLWFRDDDLDGIPDGGHNLLALARFMLSKVLASDDELKSKMLWKDVSALWSKYKDEIEAMEGTFDFLVPVEIISPSDRATGYQDYQDNILEVAQSRNNNSQLTEETKAHKAGLYGLLKESLPNDVAEKTEWRTNDSGKIKSQELIALAMVPLLAIKDKHKAISDFRPYRLYSSKGHCVAYFNKLMMDDRVSRKENGYMRVINDPLIRSALSLMKDMPALYDQIYTEFPSAYTRSATKFGSMKHVRLYDKEGTKRREKPKKYMMRRPKTRYSEQECDHEYSSAFIWPIVYGLSGIIEVKNKTAFWGTPPSEFISEHLPDLVKSHCRFMRLCDNHPATIGKFEDAYIDAKEKMRYVYEASQKK